MKKIKFSKHLIFGLILFLIILILSLIAVNSSSLFIKACETSQDFISNGFDIESGSNYYLKSPGSAQFGDCSQYYIYFVGISKDEKGKFIPDNDSSIGVYMVSGPVDSQNGFGALGRNYYCATMFNGHDGWSMWSISYSETPYNQNCFFDFTSFNKNLD